MGEIKRISKSEDIIAKLKAEGKQRVVVWTAEQQENWYKIMTELRRESNYKQAMSKIEASKTFFTS